MVDVYVACGPDNPMLWKTLFDYALPGGNDLPEALSEQIASGLAHVERVLDPLDLDAASTAPAPAKAPRIISRRLTWSASRPAG